HDQSEALVLSDHVAVMNRGRFEQLGTPQALYYEPATAFVAGFVGANNRIGGRLTGNDGEIAELTTADGWRLHARKGGAMAVGDRVFFSFDAQRAICFTSAGAAASSHG